MNERLQKLIQEANKEHEKQWAVARADKKQMKRYKEQIENSMVVFRGTAKFSY